MGGTINSYRDLIVWQKAIVLAEAIYIESAKFSRDELYGLTSQMRRACVSIPSNIAEGYGRDQTGPYVQFLRIAQGSARELETQLILSGRLGMLDAKTSEKLLAECEEISKMLRSLIRVLEAQRP